MITERVDDIPLLIAEFGKSQLSNLVTEHFPDHGNWQGVDSGKVAVIFLTYVLSCSDHRISHVETWAAQRLHVLRHCLNAPELTAKDLTDDKLGILLDRFSDQEKWLGFEQSHNQRLINVYDLGLSEQTIRLDAFITQSHREVEGDFQMGHSKQHRSDLPQLKTMVATLDPFSMPLHSVTVSGNSADDVLYMPIINDLLAHLPLQHQLFVGDSKMGSFETRWSIQNQNHFYLMPLNQKQCSEAVLMDYLDAQPKDLVTLWSKKEGELPKLKAKGFETTVTMSDESGEKSWEERRIVVYSPNYAQSQQRSFEDRQIKAQNALSVILEAKQGRKTLKKKEEVATKVDQILKKYKMKGFIEVKIEETITTKKIRRHLDKPEREISISQFSLQIKGNQAAIEKHKKKLGWRVYATNAPFDRLNTQQAIECYRNEYKIEHKFDELLNRVTALMPVYLKKPNRIKALIQLLLLALKYVSIIQFQVRQELTTTKQTLKELYPGNPGRATNQPTTPMLLRAFKNITLVILPVEDKMIIKISDLKPIQLKILDLLNISPEVYLGLNELVFSHFDFSET